MKTNYNHNWDDHRALVGALQWHLDNGADELLLDKPEDRTKVPELPAKLGEENIKSVSAQQLKQHKPADNVLGFQDIAKQIEQVNMLGASEAVIEAKKIAASCKTIEELSEAIKNFSGLSIKKTATNMVFGDGNPKAPVMLIGEAPGADEDIQGKPFAGANGLLLDKILACIDLSRTEEELSKSVYISNVLNWRPPGNRTPTQAEMDISLPFIQKHIALVQPKAIILCGGDTAKTLLMKSETISKLRGKFHELKIPAQFCDGKELNIPVVVTYHPTYLLRTPAQKRAVWSDMLMFRDKLKNI